MPNRRISHARGRGSLNHNNRNHIYKNVDASKTENNIYYAKESLDEAYQKCFGEALANYNAKQKRADRKIEDYYNHLFGNANQDTVATSSNTEKSFYEIVVGIGDMRNTAVDSTEGKLVAKILDEYAKGFSERNPNFYVFNSVLHLDEKTPHLHIDYVPIADGYKNGMAKRNSQSVALQQMGFGKNKNSINEWRIQERNIIKELCQKYGLEISEETKGRGKTLSPDEYKELRDEVKDELRADTEILDEIKDEIKTEIYSEVKKAANTDLKAEIKTERTKLNKTKEQLVNETVHVEGRIAVEKGVKLVMDGMREETRGWGSNKKSYTVIEFPDTANEQALAVLKAAQNSARDRANAKKFKADMDTAIAERNSAITAKEEAESSKLMAEFSAKTAKDNAETETANADKKMKEAKALYNQQIDLNNLYQRATTNLNYYKSKAEESDGLMEQIKGLSESLHNAYTFIRGMAQATNSLLNSPTLKLENLRPEQTRILQAIQDYAVQRAKNAGFGDIAQEIKDYYRITEGMQEHIDELMPKNKKRSNDMVMGG